MTTDKHAIYSTWAPTESPWSPWAKPAVFAHIPPELELLRPVIAPAEVSTYPASEQRQAIVVDLPGPESVAVGLGLAARGYRLVPLFNSCPPELEDTVRMIAATVDARAILEALVTGAAELALRVLPADAPPAFLLEAQRGAPGVSVGPRMFDNRSVVFAADFPSANFLRSQQIFRARVVRDPAIPVGDDLRYALRHWVAGGIALDATNIRGDALDVTWPRDGFFGELIERFRALFTLRKNPHGGYGRFVPESSGG